MVLVLRGTYQLSRVGLVLQGVATAACDSSEIWIVEMKKRVGMSLMRTVSSSQLSKGARFLLWRTQAVVNPWVPTREPLRIITAADSSHYMSLLQLLESIVRFEPTASVVIYDLGFAEDQRKELAKKVSLTSRMNLKPFEFSAYPSHFAMSKSAGSYAWKPTIFEMEMNGSAESLLLWLDAGDILKGPLFNVRRAIRKCGLWSPASAGTVEEWTHPTTLERFAVSHKALTSGNLNGAIVGIDSRSRKAKLAVHWWSLAAQHKEWIAPEGSDRSNHRQDQSLLTLIATVLSISCYPTNTLELATHQDVD